MKTRAFTLIELLVVVLIIGILAAIAVPQYQKAVMRSRFSEMVLHNDAIVKAQKAYFMANGRYTENLNDLDIILPQGHSCYMSFTGSWVWTNCTLYKGTKRLASLQTILQPRNQTDCCSSSETDYAADYLCSDLMKRKNYSVEGEGASHCFYSSIVQ